MYSSGKERVLVTEFFDALPIFVPTIENRSLLTVVPRALAKALVSRRVVYSSIYLMKRLQRDVV